LPIDELPDEMAVALAGFEIEDLFEFIPGEGKTLKGVVRKWKLRDKTPMLQMLGKHLSVLKEPTEANNNATKQFEEERQNQLELLRAMTQSERTTLAEIMDRAKARIEARKNGNPGD
jgi:hypothetical protein